MSTTAPTINKVRLRVPFIFSSFDEVIKLRISKLKEFIFSVNRKKKTANQFENKKSILSYIECQPFKIAYSTLRMQTK